MFCTKELFCFTVIVTVFVCVCCACNNADWHAPILYGQIKPIIIVSYDRYLSNVDVHLWSDWH